MPELPTDRNSLEYDNFLTVDQHCFIFLMQYLIFRHLELIIWFLKLYMSYAHIALGSIFNRINLFKSMRKMFPYFELCFFLLVDDPLRFIF